MVCLIETMNPATHSFAEAVLKEADIPYFIMNAHCSVLDGSIPLVRKRLMVIGEDVADARTVLTDAGLGKELMAE